MKRNLKHKNPTQTDRIAHAPYNFVPLPEKVVTVENVPPQDVYAEYTGYIECLLATESPIYTRAGMNAETFKAWGNTPFHQLPEEIRNRRASFFNITDAERPIIPGSSLRGMVRSLVEISGYGKMKWATREPLVFRSVGEAYYREYLVRQDSPKHYTPLMRAGYLEKDGSNWFIRPAQALGNTTFARIHHDDVPAGLTKWHNCQNAYRIWVKLGKYEYQNVRGDYIRMKYMPVLEARASAAPGFQEAVLAYSGPMDKKRREAVLFPPDNTKGVKRIPIDDDMVRRYREQISPEQQALLGSNGALNPHQPIFYLLQGDNLVFFGHVMLFRLPFKNSPFSLVPEHLKHKPDIDLAEAIFGFVPEDREDGQLACAGRVFFTNALPELGQSDFWLSETPIPPKILSGPKPTAFQHYLTQQQPDKVDTGQQDKKGRPKMELRLDHYNSPPPHETTIRGHKLYWHRGRVGLKDIREQNEDDVRDHPSQYTRIKPVRADVTFRFRIYFENLRDFELGALLWALTLPGETAKEYRHKLGMGKPLGMGSVHLQPTLHLSTRVGEAGRYDSLFSRSKDNEAPPQWHIAEAPDGAQRFIQAFNQYVLARMDQIERQDAASLKDVPRIQMLLKMLEWPGPEKAKTEYMTLSEFRQRPVLPDPLAVVAGRPVQPPVPERDRLSQERTGLRKTWPSQTGETPSRRLTGTVKWFNTEKGFGVITQEDGSELFVHHTGIIGSEGTLIQGQQVTYTIGKGPKGDDQAKNVQPI